MNEKRQHSLIPRHTKLLDTERHLLIERLLATASELHIVHLTLLGMASHHAQHTTFHVYLMHRQRSCARTKNPTIKAEVRNAQG